jgi:hypothetical protein
MNIIKALVLAIITLTIIITASASSPSKINNSQFIIRVTSTQPQDIQISYLYISNNDSRLIQTEQKTPFEVKVPAKTINAIFHADSKNSFLKVKLLKLEQNKEELLVEGKGHAIIVNSRSPDSKNAFIITR